MPKRWSSCLGGVIEGGILALVCASPWAFGATSPRSEFGMDLWLCGLACLGGVRLVLDRASAWRWCPVAACLIALVVVAAFQMVPLPAGMLRVISPGTARIYDRLLPERPEVLADGTMPPPLLPPAGSTLSFDRGVTRRDAGRILAVVLLFFLVRSNIESVAGLRRLGIAALINGSLLGFFGLIQALSAAPKTIYWTYATTGGPFGPFINRNHFAFYVNVCVGLALGLLLEQVPSIAGPTSPRGRGGSLRPRVAVVLLNPAVIGIIFATGIMISSTLFSLSRGGFLALLGSLVFGMVLLILRTRGRSLAGGAILAAPAVALALACWIGYAQITARLETLRSGNALREQRSAIWLRAMPVIRDFSLVGTGCGTFEFADMLHRADASDAGEVVDHAHNDYVETLVEGGIALFLPAILALAFTFRAGLAAALRLSGTPRWGPIVGGLMAMTAVAIHNLTDFSLHVPSCTALVVVLMALLSGLRDAAARSDPDAANPNRPRRPGLAGVGAVAAAVVMIAAGLVVVHEGWRPLRVDQIRHEVYERDQSGDPARILRKIALLDEAARTVPEDYLIREDLASAHIDAYDQALYELSGGNTPARPDAPRPLPSAADRRRLQALHLTPALRQILRSRDLSPVRALVHLEIADHVGDLGSAGPRQAYLDRAKLLAPADPDVWYRCGEIELEDGHPDRAWTSYRHALTLSETWLPEILKRATKQLTPGAILDRVLPDDPDRLLAAAEQLAGDDAAPGRRAFREKALGLLERRAAAPSAEEFHLRAATYQSLDRTEPALAAYRSALALEPMRHAWRLELADLCARSGQFEDSRQELLVILGLDPDNGAARALLDEVARKLAEGK